MSDAGRLLSDLPNEISISRKKCIIPNLRPGPAQSVAEISIIDSKLLGNDYSERLKVTKDVEKSGKELAKPFRNEKSKDYSGSSKSKNYKTRGDLNFRGPHRRYSTTPRYSRGQKSNSYQNNYQNNYRGQTKFNKKK